MLKSQMYGVVQALPLVSTFWGVVLFHEYWRSSKKTCAPCHSPGIVVPGTVACCARPVEILQLHATATGSSVHLSRTRGICRRPGSAQWSSCSMQCSTQLTGMSGCMCRYILLAAMLALFVAAVGLLMGSAGTRQN